MAKNNEEEMPNIADFIDEASGESLNLGYSQQQWLEYLYSIRAELEDHIKMVEQEIEQNEEIE